MLELHASVFPLFHNTTVKVNLLGVLQPCNIPNVTALEPGVGHLNLISVHNLLFEQTVFVSDAAAVSRQVKICQRIQEARRQTTQTSVPQTCVCLYLFNVIKGETKLFKRLSVHFSFHNVHKIVAHCATHKELKGQIVKLFLSLLLCFFLIADPFFHNLVANGESRRSVHLDICGLIHRLTEVTLNLTGNLRFDKFLLLIKFRRARL